jgi:hypothetical protein
MSLRNVLLAAGLALVSTLPAAHAAEPVLIAPSIDVGATPEVATINRPAASCTWGRALASEIVRRGSGAVRTTDLAPAAVPGRYFALATVGMKLNSAYMAPKWIRLRGDMMEGGKVIATFEFYRSTGHDAGKPCAQAHYLGNLLAKRIAKWLRANGSLPAAELAAMQKPLTPADDAGAAEGEGDDAP